MQTNIKKQIESQLNASQTVATRGTRTDDLATMLATEAAIASVACANDGATPVIDIGRVCIVACPITR